MDLRRDGIAGIRFWTTTGRTEYIVEGRNVFFSFKIRGGLSTISENDSVRSAAAMLTRLCIQRIWCHRLECAANGEASAICIAKI